MNRMLIAALVFGLIAITATAARAGGGTGAEGGEDAFARALAAYDSGRYGDAAGTWARLAEDGNVDAMAALAGLYRQGLGVPRDAARAAALYRRAGLAGHVMSQANLGEMLSKGEGISHSEILAFSWFRLAAEGGNAWAGQKAAEIWARLGSDQRLQACQNLTRLKKIYQRVANPLAPGC